MKGKNDNFYLLQKKLIFGRFFLLFTASIRSQKPEPPLVPGELALVAAFFKDIDNNLNLIKVIVVGCVHECVVTKTLAMNSKQHNIHSNIIWHYQSSPEEEVLDNNLRTECNHDFFALR